MNSPHTLQLYASPPHPCVYLEGREAVTLFMDPAAVTDPLIYSELARHGFRRSGSHIYRPACHHCTACHSVRIPVADFRHRRRERRIWQRNQDLHIRRRALGFNPAHFELYARYLAARHAGGGMDNPSPEQYMDFLEAPWSDTQLCEFLLGEQLLAVAVYDRLASGLSAVYTFFDPDQGRRSLGTYSILWQVEETRRLGLDWLYLGYWIEDCEKMRYKGSFRPLQAFIDNRWTTM